MKPIRFINQRKSAMECLYQPAMACGTGATTGMGMGMEMGGGELTPPMISKITTTASQVDHEVVISERIRGEIENYRYYFAPIESTCGLEQTPDMANMDNQERGKCALFDPPEPEPQPHPQIGGADDFYRNNAYDADADADADGPMIQFKEGRMPDDRRSVGSRNDAGTDGRVGEAKEARGSFAADAIGREGGRSPYASYRKYCPCPYVHASFSSTVNVK
jgi:hypothetical protein